MTSESNKKIIQQYFLEMWNHKNFELVDKLVHQDYLHHKPDGTTATGREPIRRVMKLVFESYPDVQWEIKLQVAEGDLVATYIEGHANHPNKAHFKEAFYHRIKDAVLVEGWVLPVKQ
jgi:predicted SnoaL-like aldol condensation-catalyzing enzyme